MMNKFGKQLSVWAFVSMTVLGTSFMNLTRIHASESENLNMPVKTVTPLKGSDSIEVKQYIVMNNSANVPYVKFNYSISAGDTVTDSTSGKTLVYSPADTSRVTGKVSDITITQAKFAQTDSAFTAADAEGNGDTVSLAKDQKYAMAYFKINMSAISFKEPGIYRFVLHQTDLADDIFSTIYKLDSANESFSSNPLSYGGDRYLDVYVVSDQYSSNDTLSFGNFVIRNKASLDDADKTTGFTSTYNTHDLTIYPTVSGNQSATDDVFEYNLNFELRADHTRLNIVYDDTTSTLDNPTYIETTATTDGSYTTKGSVKIKANQKLTICGIPNNYGYSVHQKDDNKNPLGYKSKLVTTGSSGDLIDNGRDGTGTGSIFWTGYSTYDYELKADTVLNIDYEKNGIIPTGIIVTVVPYGSLALAGLVGAVVLAKRKKSSEEE